MSPVRSKPQQVCDHYADLIDRGELLPGQPFPSIRAIAAEQGVGPDTVQVAVGMLAGGGRIEKVPGRGFIVSRRARENVASPMERRRPPRLVAVPSVAEVIEVTAAGSVPPPEYVTGILGIRPGELVIRREEVASVEDAPVRLTVQWVPAVGGQITCAHLLEQVPVEGGVLGCVERATGRTAAYARESERAEGADARESRMLRVPYGDPVLGIVNTYCDADGVLLYEETIYRCDKVISRRYELGGED